MKPTLKISAFTLFAMLLLTGFDKSGTGQVDFGSIHEGVYTNNYFGFSIPLPENWVVQSRAEEKQLMDTGTDMIAGEDKAMKRAMQQAEKKTVNMFTVFEHEIGAAVEFNPSVIAIGENISASPGVKTAKDYFFHMRKVLNAAQMNYQFPTEVYPTELSGKEFDVMPVSVRYGEITVNQLYYAKRVGDYMLVYIISYADEAQKKKLLEILNGVRFTA